MKKIAYILIIILFVSFFQFSSCFLSGDPSPYEYYVWTSFIGCFFFGDCDDWFWILSGSEATFAAVDNNNGKTLDGSWKATDKDLYYILTFEKQGALSIAQHKTTDNSIIRYERGKYSTEDNNLIIEMENGTFSVVQYSITNGTLKLFVEKEKEDLINKID